MFFRQRRPGLRVAVHVVEFRTMTNKRDVYGDLL